MANPAVTLRSDKGSALTFTEVDSNFQNLANATINVTAGGTTSNVNLNSALTVANSATVQATLSGSTLTLTSNISPTTSIQVTAGGSTSSGLGGFTIANTATVQATQSSGTISIVSNAYVNWTANVQANGQYLEYPILNAYREKIAAHATTSGAISINANVATIQTVTTTGNLLIWANNMSNFGSGESVTLLLRHNANTRSISSDLLFINQNKTIGGTTACVDAVTIFYDGTSYLASVAKFQA